MPVMQMLLRGGLVPFVSATAAPASVSRTSITSPVVSPLTVASAVGGNDPLSFQWEYVSGTALTIDSPTSNSTTFSKVLTSGQTVVGVYRCKITDSTGAIIYTNNVTITLTRE